MGTTWPYEVEIIFVLPEAFSSDLPGGGKK